MSVDGTRRRVLVTGGAGAIAQSFAEWAQDLYELTLLDLPGRFEHRHASLGRLIEADIGDLDKLKAAFEEANTVLHLGGERSPSALWSDLLPKNIIGTYNVVAAAVSQQCRRVVYASSVHAVSGSPPTVQTRESDAIRPGDLYGVSKCFGEALGSYASAAEGLSFVALRIGAFQDPDKVSEPGAGWMLRDYCEPTDLFRLIHHVIEAEDIQFEVYNAVSSSALSRMSMEKAHRDLGFQPEFDSLRLSRPMREAITYLGGLADSAVLSGMREDLGMLTRSSGR